MLANCPLKMCEGYKFGWFLLILEHREIVCMCYMKCSWKVMKMYEISKMCCKYHKISLYQKKATWTI
jgi:hypothetical protein